MNTFVSVATAALTLWLLLGEPLLGRFSHRRMLQALDSGDRDARLRFYRSWTFQGWLLAAVTLAVCAANGWSLGQLGLRSPHALLELSPAFAAGFLGSLIVGFLFAAVAGRYRRRTQTQAPPPRIAGGENVLRMLPRGRRERIAFALLAVTAGITEELIWRGFGATLLHTLAPHWPQLLTIGVLAAVFGWAHFYQGAAGMLVTAVLGGLFAWLYLASGSLWWPILLHVLVDLRALLLPVPTDPLVIPASPET